MMELMMVDLMDALMVPKMVDQRVPPTAAKKVVMMGVTTVVMKVDSMA